MAAPKTYDPSQISVIIGGASITGFAEGTMISVARNEDAFSYAPSTTGGGSRVKNSNKSGRITLTLQKTSESNEILDNYADLDEVSNDGIFSSLVRDNNGKDLHKGESCWVVKKPDSEESKELPTREWIIEVAELEMNVKGA